MCGANPIKGGRRSSPLQGDLCLTQGTGVGVNLRKGAPLFTLYKGRGECWRLRRKKVRGLPVMHSPPATTMAALPTLGPPIFTLSWGRGRRRCTHRQSVRGLPRTQARVTQSSLLGERRILATSPAEGEGSSGQPATGYAKVTSGGDGWGESLLFVPLSLLSPLPSPFRTRATTPSVSRGRMRVPRVTEAQRRR